MANTITLANIRPRMLANSNDLLPGVRHVRLKFQSWICLYGKLTYIGSFDTNLEAGIAWLNAKIRRDSSYLKEFEENLLNDKSRLAKLKAEQERENKRAA